MYAVIETGGKQYRVEVGTELEVELLDVEPGKTINLDRVLLVADGDTSAIGRPVVENASVSAEVVTQTRGPKLISFKYRPKARSRVKKGHRQELTVLRISDIVLDGKSAAAVAAKAEEARKTERQRLEDAARRQAEQDAALAAKLAADKATADKATAGKATADKDKKTAAKTATKASSSAKADKATAAKPSGRTAKADTTGTGDKARPAARKASGTKSAAPKKTQK